MFIDKDKILSLWCRLKYNIKYFLFLVAVSSLYLWIDKLFWFVDLIWGHSTQSMCIGYMTSTSKVKVRLHLESLKKKICLPKHYYQIFSILVVVFDVCYFLLMLSSLILLKSDLHPNSPLLINLFCCSLLFFQYVCTVISIMSNYFWDKHDVFCKTRKSTTGEKLIHFNNVYCTANYCFFCCFFSLKKLILWHLKLSVLTPDHVLKYVMTVLTLINIAFKQYNWKPRYYMLIYTSKFDVSDVCFETWSPPESRTYFSSSRSTCAVTEKKSRKKMFYICRRKLIKTAVTAICLAVFTLSIFIYR